MNNEKLTETSSSGIEEKAKQAPSSVKDAIARRRAHISMVQNVLLIWLDDNIDGISDDCQNKLLQLRSVVNNVNMFTDGDECVNFITAIEDNKICMVISDSLGQHIVSTVHDMPQVDSIFTFCDIKQCHEGWVKNWPKIKGIFTEIKLICEALKQAAQKCEHNAISISFLSTSGADSSKKKLDQLDCSFMYTQILKEILLMIQFEQQHIKEFIDYCCEVFKDDAIELSKIEQLKETYYHKTPIWWYTCPGFLYPMLNRALRVMDVDILIKIGFFIGDLHRHIEKLHSEQYRDHNSNHVFTVYRGQGLFKTDFEQLTKTKGGLIAFNNFLSTSKDRDVSFAFAESNQSNPDLVGILFVMKTDPSTSSTPFASINNVSYFKDNENEVLFSMHTVFRIREIQQMGENNRFWQVDLVLTSDNDPELHVLTEHMREEIQGTSGWFQLGRLLIKVGQPAKAEQLFEHMLKQKFDDSDKANFLHELGSANDDQGKYIAALSFYKSSLEIRQKTLPSNHPDLAESYECIGTVYYDMDENSKALSYYEKALEIRQNALPLNHLDLASSQNGIGLVYDRMGEYSKALSSHEKALEIFEETLPSNHPDLASSYNNIGLVYHKMGEYSKAVSYYEKDLEISQKSLPSNHPDLAKSYNNIGGVYNSMGEYWKAFSSHEKALEIRQKSLPTNHPELALSYNNLGNVYKNIGKYSKALSYLKKALEIRKSLPSNHPDLAHSYNDIGEVYQYIDDNSQALSYYEEALEIRQKILSSNHPDLATSYNNMGEYWKAFSFYERAVDIGQCSLPSNNPELQKWRDNRDLVKKKL